MLNSRSGEINPVTVGLIFSYWLAAVMNPGHHFAASFMVHATNGWAGLKKTHGDLKRPEKSSVFSGSLRTQNCQVFHVLHVVCSRALCWNIWVMSFNVLCVFSCCRVRKENHGCTTSCFFILFARFFIQSFSSGRTDAQASIWWMLSAGQEPFSSLRIAPRQAEDVTWIQRAPCSAVWQEQRVSSPGE